MKTTIKRLCVTALFAATQLIPYPVMAQEMCMKYAGGDISLLPSYEASNTVYLDNNGNKINDLIPWLISECGWNSFRVRLFVEPKKKDAKGKLDPAVCQDINYVKALGKRIKDAGAQFMLDFHYSDTWVDASHIQAPDICKDMNVEEKANWIYDYTKEQLELLKQNGATPDLVQVGNEIMYGFMGIKVAPFDSNNSDWESYLKVLKNGCKAVREICPDAKIIIHTDRPANAEYNKYYYQKLDDAEVEYDVIGLSFYPFWHGWLISHPSDYNYGLINALNLLKSDFPTKKVQIVETAYNFQYWPTSGVNYNTQDTWECSAYGQQKFVSDLITELKNHDNVDGVFYWCPEEAGNGDAANWSTNDGVVIVDWLNRGLWWSANSNGHWPLASGGKMTAELLKDYASTPTGIIEAGITTHYSSVTKNIYNLNGQCVGTSTENLPTGIYIKNNKKIKIHQ